MRNSFAKPVATTALFRKYLSSSHLVHSSSKPSFWDWSLDWEDLPNSLIFDPELGFGGDGDSEAPTFGNAHCVTSMPFKGLKPQWAGTKYDPHCLTRSFNDDDWVGHFLSPTSLAEVMAKDNYKDFFLALEMRAHDIIPTGVRGDFTAFTAPNGRLHLISRWKHHAQADPFTRSHILPPPRATGPHLVAMANAR